MKIRTYLGALIGITVVVFMAGMYPTPSVGSDSGSDSGQAENATKHDSTGNWQTVLMGNGKECEGLVFESVEDAKEAALQIGCSGYHEHHQEDGTVLYMPCDLKLTDTTLNVEGIKAEIQDALVRGEITQEQVDEKLAWLEVKDLEQKVDWVTITASDVIITREQRDANPIGCDVDSEASWFQGSGRGGTVMVEAFAIWAFETTDNWFFFD